MANASKVGIFVLVFFAMIIGAYQILGKSLFKREVDRYDVVIADAAGVVEGAKVLMAGVKIGSVLSVKLDGPNRARITLAIDKGVGIPVGSGAAIPTSLIGFGDNPIQIVPPAKQSSTILEPGAELVGVRLSPLQGIIPDTAATLEEVNKTLKATRKLIEDESLKTSITSLMSSSAATVEKFGALAQKIDGLLVDNRASLTQAIQSASLTMKEVQKTTAAIQEMASDPRWKDKIAGLLDTLTATAKSADDMVKGLDAFANDPAMQQSLKASVANAEAISASGSKIALSAEDIAKNGVVISEKVSTLMDKANDIAEQTQKLLDKLGGVLGKAPSGKVLEDFGVSLDLNRETKPNRWRTDLEATLPLGDQIVHLGLYDAFESNKITLQLSQPLASQARVRYGIYASKPGVGVDFRLAPKLSLRGDLFDINDPRLDLRAKYEFGKGFYGYIGLDRLFDRNAPTLGIGFRK